MTPERYRQVNEIVERALEREEQERARFVSEMCHDDTGLQLEVERLLARANKSVAGFLQMPPLPRIPAGTEDLPAQVGRYHLEGEIARGGMGRVLRIRDEDFDRPLAMKVLLDSVRGQGDLEERFVREARLTGVLQHPGIPPVHALGRLPDGRPYFVMKLIQGRSLHEILKERSQTPGSVDREPLPVDRGPRTGNREPGTVDREGDGSRSTVHGPRFTLPHLVGIFGQICQTLGYAHARGVIHRDLKPANVMVGAFGEVQVMDWGLAKVLPGSVDRGPSFVDRGPWTVDRENDGPRSTVHGLGFPLAAEATTADSVMGTPAYMAPEQAHGEVDKMDARTDVFGLGAILCEILTGAPPYRGRNRHEILLRATQEDLGETFVRLAHCGADPELVDLARSCLAPRPEARPANGSAVAAAVAAYQAELERRLRQAELDRAAADARADEESKRRQAEQAKALAERKRRRLALALAASLLLMAVGGSMAWLWYQNDQARQEAEQARQQAELALRREYVNKQVKTALEDVSRQRQALHEKLKDPLQVNDLLSDIDQWQTRLQTTRAEWLLADSLAKADRELLQPAQAQQLADLQNGLTADERDWAVAKELDDIRGRASTLMEGSKVSFASTTKAYAEVFARIGLAVDTGEPATLAHAIAQLPLRYVLVGTLDHWADVAPDDQLRGQLLEVARRADRHPWRDRFRDVKAWNDAKMLEQLARDVRPEQHSAHVLTALSKRLEEKGGDPAGILRQAILHRPRDFWLYREMGCVVKDQAEQAGCFQTALAIRPRDGLTHFNLGVALRRRGDLDGAIEHCDLAIKMNPKNAAAHNTRGIALYEQKHLEQSIAAYRQAIAIDPSFVFAYSNLGHALVGDSRVDEAIPLYRRAIELELGEAKEKKFSSALFYSLGNALRADKRAQQAITAYQLAVGLDPENANAYVNLGTVYFGLQRFPDSLKEYQKASELDPKDGTAHFLLGNVYDQLQRFNDAIREYKRAIDLDPKFVYAYDSLGNALHHKMRLSDAAEAYRKAIEFDSRYVPAHNHLFNVLLEQGAFADAVESGKLFLQLDLYPKGHPLRKVAESRLKKAQHLLALEKRLPAVMEGKDPAHAGDLLDLAQMCRQYKKRYFTAAHLFQEAFKAQPELAEPYRANAACAAVLAGSGQGEEAGKLADDEKAREKLRRQGRDWLRADLDLYAKHAQTGEVRSILRTISRLAEWQKDSDLAGVRDPSELPRLPVEERQTWQKLWQDVQQTLHDAQGRFRETPLDGTLTLENKSKVHAIKMSAGKTYVLDMESTAFDTYLKLFDAQNKLLAENDDISPENTNSQIIYTITENGIYHLVATSCIGSAGTGRQPFLGLAG